MTAEEFDKILHIAKSHGVMSFKLDTLSVDFVAQYPEVKRPVMIGDEEHAPTEDQMLFYSSPLGSPDHIAEPPV